VMCPSAAYTRNTTARMTKKCARSWNATLSQGHARFVQPAAQLEQILDVKCDYTSGETT
jgi:hypothetical protein